MIITQDSELMLKNVKVIDENAKGVIRRNFDPNCSSDDDMSSVGSFDSNSHSQKKVESKKDNVPEGSNNQDSFSTLDPKEYKYIF